MSSYSDEFSVTATGQQSYEDAFELAVQPGYQRRPEAKNPLDKDLRAPDPTFQPIEHARWKKERADKNREENIPIRDDYTKE